MPEAPEFNDWTLTFLSPLPGWALVLVGLALVAAVVMAHLGLKGERRRWRRWLLTGLRAVAVLAAFVLLTEPALQLLQVRRVKNRVAVLVDTSASMALPEGQGTRTRLQAVQDLLKDDAWFARHADRFVFEVAAFDEAPSPSDRARLAALETPDGRRTDLLAALETVAQAEGAGGGRRLAGVLLFTDGADTEGLGAALDDAGKRAAEALGAPIHAFLAGRPGAVKDLAVARVRHDDFAFVRSAVEVEAVLRHRGYAGQEVPVVLRREGAVVSSRTVRLSETGEDRVSFRFTPDTTGKFVYTLSVPLLPDEAVPSNNERAFTLKIIRDRVRVLQVAGRPSWDERFLRAHLEQDPNVDLISFFILRTRQDEAVSNADLSLIPFPTTELFTQELKTFDLVVFQNFDYLPYNMAQYLDDVRAYVEDGGAFVMIGGERSFSDGRYQGTYIEDLLPVRLLPPGLETVDTEPFQPRLTEEGKRHPVTRLNGAGGGLERLLTQLPDLHGVNRVAEVKAEGQVLLEHPFVTLGEGRAPVLVAGEYGRGRTLALLTDSIWFWSLPAAGQGADHRIYDRFWNQALRWLVRDPDLTNVKLRPVAEAFEPGEPVALEVSVSDAAYGPAAEAPVKVEVKDATGRVVAVRETRTGADGLAGVELPPEALAGPDGARLVGAFKATAEARDPESGEVLGTETTAFVIRGITAEQVDPTPRPALLESLADLTDGSFHTLPMGGLPDLKFVDPEVVEVGRKKNVDLWDRWYFLAVLAGAIALEWYLRRRWGQA